MRNGLLLGIAALGIAFTAGTARADQITGVLIDQTCGAKRMSNCLGADQRNEEKRGAERADDRTRSGNAIDRP